MKVRLSLALILCFSSSYAKDLGQHGTVYPVIENNLLDLMVERVDHMQKTGELRMRQNEMISGIEKQINEPSPVLGLSPSEMDRVSYIELGTILEKPILDKNGKILIAKGTRINPLDLIDFTSSLYFIDGNDDKQIEWALNEGGINAIILLVDGSVLDLMKKYDAKFYFDQEGVLVKKLGIKQIPAKVEPFGNMLKVHEVNI
ncbi:MAG: type-F conjugative transfer system protein TraW [Legionellales bacterium]|jgi:conjugal transfer pilus assembly protein TraW